MLFVIIYKKVKVKVDDNWLDMNSLNHWLLLLSYIPAYVRDRTKGVRFLFVGWRLIKQRNQLTLHFGLCIHHSWAQFRILRFCYGWIMTAWPAEVAPNEAEKSMPAKGTTKTKNLSVFSTEFVYILNKFSQLFMWDIWNSCVHLNCITHTHLFFPDSGHREPYNNGWLLQKVNSIFLFVRSNWMT